MKSMLFHKYSWNSEVETIWISLIGWHYKTSNIYVLISDVESQEDARLCNFWEDVCYGKLTIAEVNVTLSHGSIMDLIEIKIQKGKEHLRNLFT